MGWLQDYGYRKKITITGGAGGAQTDYQIRLDVAYESSMAYDFKDIRFTKADGVTEIDAYCRSVYHYVSADIWVEFPTTPANTVVEYYYMYYGNPIAAAGWDMDGTFILADDFTGYSIDTSKWTSTQGPSTGYNYIYFHEGDNISSLAAYDFSQPVRIEYDLRVSGAVIAENWYMRLIDRDGLVCDVGSVWNKGKKNFIYGNGVGYYWLYAPAQDVTTDFTTQVHIIIPNDKYMWSNTNGNPWDGTSTKPGYFPPAANRYIDLRNSPTTGCAVYLYNIFISKYVEGEPTYLVGIEEEENISISVPRWSVYFDGVNQKGVQNIDVLTTIAGSSKTEMVLSDVSNLNDIAHFADIEVWSQCDDVDGGLVFDGNSDYIELANTIELTYNDFAISWWMKRDSLSHSCIFCETKNGTEGFIGIYGPWNIIHFATPLVPYDMYYWTGLATDDGLWHHYVFNSTTTQTELYIDGMLIDSTYANADTADFKINYIGYDQSSPGGDYFDGSIAYITIYDQAITDAEVENLYSGFNKLQPINFWTLAQSTDQADGIYDRMEASHGTSYTSAVGLGALPLDTSPLNQFIAFKGRVDLLLPDYDTDTLTITGRDYLSDLLARACVESYTTRLRSYIVNDVVLKYGTSMSRNNISDSPTGTEISYLFKTDSWSAIVKCAMEDNYKFYCDTDKDFHYIPKGWNNSGVTLTVGTDDVLTYNIIEQDSDVINRVIVYGYDDGVDQVIVQADDLDSQDAYGVINEKKLIDTELLTEQAAEDFAYAYLADHSIVLEIIEMDIIGNETLAPGDLIHLVIPTLNIDSDHLIIDKVLKYPTNVTTIRVAKYAKNLEKVIQSMIDKILSLEAIFQDSGSDVLKLFRINEAALFTDRVTVEKKPATLDAFVVGVSRVGIDRIGSRGTGVWEEIYDSGYQ